MKSNLKKIIILFIGLVIAYSLNNSLINNIGTQNEVNIPKLSATNPIFIDDASTNNWTWAVSQSWCSGSGTELNPYIIENLTIDGFGTEDGIEIWNSNVFFIIQDCLIYNSSAGIYLDKVNNSRLINNNCSNNSEGIYIDRGDNNTISGNTANGNNNEGIILYEGDYNYFTGNTVNENSDGIKIDTSCDNNFIGGNTANDNDIAGIYLGDSDYNNITGNTANGNIDGIYLADLNYNNSITGNSVSNNHMGIEIYYGGFNSIIGNTANHNAYYGIRNEGSNRNTINGNTANNNTDYGIYMHESSENNTISGNTANDNGDDGIYLENCDNNIISGNTANDNSIRLGNSDCNNITGNTVNDHTGDPGIYLFYSNHNTVSGNTANYNGEAISIQNSHYNNITGNTVNNNDNFGIYLYEGSNNTIKGNKASNNNYGIGIEENCEYNEITENMINNNTIGLEIGIDCNNTLVFKNFFLNNGIHAVDDGTDNKWNSTTIGNYWDNWTTPDVSPNDGIVDDQYTYIGGSAGSIDYLPIAEDGAPVIVIDLPTPGSVFGVSAPSFVVRITDVLVDSMWYSIDGGLHNYTFTENSTIDQIAWSALPEGSITITFYAIDIIGNEASEYVIITKSIPVETPDPGIIILIVVLSVVGGVVLIGVGYFFYKKRSVIE